MISYIFFRYTSDNLFQASVSKIIFAGNLLKIILHCYVYFFLYSKIFQIVAKFKYIDFPLQIPPLFLVGELFNHPNLTTFFFLLTFCINSTLLSVFKKNQNKKNLSLYKINFVSVISSISRNISFKRECCICC